MGREPNSSLRSIGTGIVRWSSLVRKARVGDTGNIAARVSDTGNIVARVSDARNNVARVSDARTAPT